MGTSFALKFISGKYQGGEFPVAEDHDLIVGRAAEFDMVLVEDMVSRKHAKISTQDGHLCIEDLGSTNGTFVNGERIDAETSLQEGDRILIGTSILRVVSTTPNSAANPQSASKEQKKEPIRAASGDDISGLLDEVRIPDLLALLNSAKKTGVLEANAADQCGKIFVRDGNIFYATINDNEEMGPHKVLSRLVGWESGHYQFGPMDDDLNFVFEIEESLSSLVSVAQETHAAFKKVEAELPALDSDLSLAKPLEANLSELDGAQLDILQLIHNHGQLQSVLDEAITNDPSTASIVTELIKQGYVVIF